MIEQLKELLQLYSSKQIGPALRSRPELKKWIINKTSYLPVTATSGQRIYDILNGHPSNCQYGKEKTFISITHGYKDSCGKTGKCKCATERVSKSVSKTKRLTTDEEKKEINDKRSATILKLSNGRYSNNGQSPSAKAAHKAFYDDKDNVKNALTKQIQTLLDTYQVTNAYHIPGVAEKKSETLSNTYGPGITNPSQVEEIARKAALTRLKNGISVESRIKSFEKIKERFSQDYNLDILMEAESFTGVNDIKKFDVKCKECRSVFQARIDYGHKPVCRYCHPLRVNRRSGEEKEIGDYIESIYDGQIQYSDRSLINPWEVDIYLPELNLAIEYCGLYWHQEDMGKDKNYHRNKMIKLENKGIRLITIFGDEWINNSIIVKSRLRNFLGLVENRIGARKLELRKLSKTESIEFFKENHIQGSCDSMVSWGLLSNDIVYSAMSFSEKRIALGGKKTPSEYELARFANKLDWVVPGAASRLLNAFKNEYNPSEIISYADLRWSQGNLYEHIGFTAQPDEPVGYFYTKDYVSRLNRFSFRKSVLTKMGMPEELTEKQSMELLGYKRIWDCGIRKYVWKPN